METLMDELSRLVKLYFTVTVTGRAYITAIVRKSLWRSNCTIGSGKMDQEKVGRPKTRRGEVFRNQQGSTNKKHSH